MSPPSFTLQQIPMGGAEIIEMNRTWLCLWLLERSGLRERGWMHCVSYEESGEGLRKATCLVGISREASWRRGYLSWSQRLTGLTMRVGEEAAWTPMCLPLSVPTPPKGPISHCPLPLIWGLQTPISGNAPFPKTRELSSQMRWCHSWWRHAW